MKLLEKITRREYYRDKFKREYETKLKDAMLEYLEQGKLKVQKTDSLTLEQSLIEEPMVIVATRADIYGNIFASYSTIALSPKACSTGCRASKCVKS